VTRRLGRLACGLGVHDVQLKETWVRSRVGKLQLLWVGCRRGCGLELSWQSIWHEAKWVPCICGQWHPTTDTFAGADLVGCPSVREGQLWFINQEFMRRLRA
jgi:hypothetical protein